MNKKLHRSGSDKKLFGVCGGIAEYFDLDATIIRLIWVITLFFAGTGIFIYLICALVMPVEKENPIEYEYIHRADNRSDSNS